MKNRTVGNMCSTIGAPFWISTLSMYSGLHSKYPFQFLLSAATAALTLPLAPFSIIGSNILQKCDKEDFEKSTSHLPKINLPNEYAYIDSNIQDGVEVWYGIIDYSDEGFYKCSSELEAREWLSLKGYTEVVALNYPNHLDTYWVKL